MEKVVEERYVAVELRTPFNNASIENVLKPITSHFFTIENKNSTRIVIRFSTAASEQEIRDILMPCGEFIAYEGTGTVANLRPNQRFNDKDLPVAGSLTHGTYHPIFRAS